MAELEQRIMDTVKMTVATEVERAIGSALREQVSELVGEELEEALGELENIPERVTVLEGKVQGIENNREGPQNLTLGGGKGEERLELLERATKTLLHLVGLLDERQTDQEGRQRRGNLRIKAVKEGEDKPAGGTIPLAEEILGVFFT